LQSSGMPSCCWIVQNGVYFISISFVIWNKNMWFKHLLCHFIDTLNLQSHCTYIWHAHICATLSPFQCIAPYQCIAGTSDMHANVCATLSPFLAAAALHARCRWAFGLLERM
jgi:hypothetical protein